jgi:hypothetical protein
LTIYLYYFVSTLFCCYTVRNFLFTICQVTDEAVYDSQFSLLRTVIQMSFLLVKELRITGSLTLVGKNFHLIYHYHCLLPLSNPPNRYTVTYLLGGLQIKQEYFPVAVVCLQGYHRIIHVLWCSLSFGSRNPDNVVTDIEIMARSISVLVSGLQLWNRFY